MLLMPYFHFIVLIEKQAHIYLINKEIFYDKKSLQEHCTLTVRFVSKLLSTKPLK